MILIVDYAFNKLLQLLEEKARVTLLSLFQRF
jgi:hypothetical protein